MTQELVAIVMAAGKGTRMKSDLPKVLHPLAGEPLLGHVLHTLESLAPKETYVIIGHGGDQVETMLPETATAVWQREQLGTGHAVDQVTPFLGQFPGLALILSGDVPLLSAETLKALAEQHQREGAVLSLLTADLPDPTGYGRVLRNAEGQVTGIVEHKDATPEQRETREGNMGTYLCAWPLLAVALRSLTPNNAQGEYYLTDAISFLVKAGHKVTAYKTADPMECAGINTRAELAKLQAEYNRRTAAKWMAEGVTFVLPDTNIVGPRVRLGKDTLLEPGALLLGTTTVGEGTVVGAYSQLNNAEIGNDVRILHTYIIDSSVGDGTEVGPYAHLRAHAAIGKNVRLGNFVEVKNSSLDDGAKAAHLAYLGDATVGKKVNIGCGVITVNYDGVKKSRTTIDDGAFVGSNSNLIAPITIHEEAFVAAGSTITEDVPAGALAIGRGKQVNKEEWVTKRKSTQAR
jgi:bifunctional UDP-N-acetylglucosamine pyrophosphorylase/glucosamine-1-phosphate N-acetyltransferase